MRKAWVFLLVAFALLAGGRVQAVVLGTNAAAVNLPLYQSTPSREIVYGDLQVQFIFKGKSIWAYEKASGEYAGVFPAGISTEKMKNVIFKAYPNVLSTHAVVAMAASESELFQNAAYTYDRKTKQFAFKSAKGLVPLCRDASGRYALEVALMEDAGTDSHCIRFYALVKDARREDKAFLVIFRWASKRPGIGLVEYFLFNTEQWPTDCGEPTDDQLTNYFRRAGNSGKGQVFRSLIEADRQAAGVKTDAAKDAKVPESESAAGNVSQNKTGDAINSIGTAVNANADALAAVDRNTQKIAAKVNELTAENATLKAKVQDLTSWAYAVSEQKAVSTASASSSTYSSRNHAYTVAFVKGKGGWYEQDSIKGMLSEKVVYIKCYSEGTGKWVTGYVDRGLVYVNEKFTSASIQRTLYWRLSQTESWRTLNYTVKTTTQYIVVATGN